ncbi:polyprotein [Gossypium australe]|uniref:Polyprotein n=1 Tax=Gossypium australe TaxID=47621 RepID=A0A5B6TWX3_9ROSI|nr:polyprotein [Gossypium australe]
MIRTRVVHQILGVTYDDKLNGLNFLDWFRNLRIVLKQEWKLYVIEQPLPNEPPANASRTDRDAYKKYLDDMIDVGCLMLATMNLELQKQHEDMVAYDMIEHLKELYQGQARQERFDISKALFQCKLAEGSPVGPHVLKMIGYIESLSKLGFPLSQELATDVILQSLPDSYSQFVLNFNMNEIDKTLPQLLSMLRTAEGNLKKVGPKPILMVRNNKGKGKAKVQTKPKGKGKPKFGKGKAALKPKGRVSKEGNCFHCGVTGHWKRNCPVYLEEVNKAKASGMSASDTGCGSHICTSVQGLQRSRTLARGDVDLRVGNGAKVAALAVGTYTLSLPSGLDLCLEDCYLVPICESCLLGKMTKSPFSGKGEQASDLLSLIHSDACGPINTQARGGFHYFITFTDDFKSQDTTEPEIEQKQIPQEIEEQTTAVEAQPPPRSLRERRAPERYGFLITTHGDVLLIDQDEPRTYQEAVTSPDSEKWLEAMRSEMDSMYENQVWTLIDPPEGVKPIGCKWVFKKKTDMDGNVQTYKGRLVAKGFRQIHGVDYDETFSSVAMFKSIRILLAIATFHDYEIWQMDVKTAFLNGKLEEDVYMTQPEGFQASQSWNIRFNDAIKEFGFIKNEDEPCVYKKVSGSTITFLVLYVDDILIMGNDIPTLQSIKTWLRSCFSMKDLGEATYILGVKIYRDRSRRLLGLSQSTYIDKVLKRFSMEESKRGFLPMRHGISLSKEMYPSTPQERECMSKIPYASAIGSIMYAMLCTRLDVSYALSMTSRYQVDPGEGHWTIVKSILKYLRRTKDTFLLYGGEEELSVKGYTDASFQTDKDDSRSQSSFVFCLNGGAVSWKSSKQSTVADSTTEAEYIVASEAAKEAVWIKNFITGLGVVPSISDAIELRCDNNGAIAQAK